MKTRKIKKYLRIFRNLIKNKTTYFPQSESLKKNILFKFKKLNEEKNKNEKISVSKSKSKSKSKEKNIQIKVEKLQKKLILLRMIKNIII